MTVTKEITTERPAMTFRYASAGAGSLSRGHRSTVEPHGVRSMLPSRRLVGERTYRGEVVATGCWPQILDNLTAAQVRNQLAGQPGGAQRRPSPSLLQGRVRCGRCGTPMHSRGRQDLPRYVCPPPRGCGRISIDRPALDAWAKAAVLARLEARAPANHRMAADRRLADSVIVQCLDDQTGRLEELNRRYYVTAELTYPEWVRARDALLATTEEAVTAVGPQESLRGFPPGRRLAEAGHLWDQLSPGARRGVIGTELAWVRIAPARAHNGVWYPDRIQPHWHRPAPAGTAMDSGRPRRLRGRRDTEALSAAAAGRSLGVGETVIRRLVAAGALVPTDGQPRRFTPAALDACIENSRIQSSASGWTASG